MPVASMLAMRPIRPEREQRGTMWRWRGVVQRSSNLDGDSDKQAGQGEVSGDEMRRQEPGAQDGIDSDSGQS